MEYLLIWQKGMVARMKRNIFSLFLAAVLLLKCFPCCAMATTYSEESNSDTLESAQLTEEKASPRIFPRQESYPEGEYDAVTMQGNTESASDCKTFRDALLNKGNTYLSVDRIGWYEENGKAKENYNRVTQDEFRSIYHKDVAYYSGHGGFTAVNGTYYPFVNFTPSNPDNDFGNSIPINVATTFCVDGSDWLTDSYLVPIDPLKVLVLASCYQLDSHIVKYYARMMKASGVRAIAGYHDIAPSDGDDTIATNFINNAESGSSIWASWKNANSGKNWAVLVYQDKSNQYYRMPGFPGARYDAPDRTTSVYRYANFLDPYAAVPTGIEDSLMEQIENLPLTITTSEIQSRIAAPETLRETAHSDYSIADDDTLVLDYLAENLSENLSNNTIRVQHYISCEEIDVDDGVLEDTAVIVERTYDYYDTYQGIKIADSFAGASIDREGIKDVSDNRKAVISVGETVAQSARSCNLITEDEAVDIARSEDTCCDFDLINTSLAYAPLENGEHVLCYEVMSSHGFCYVDIQTGNIIHLV